MPGKQRHNASNENTWEVWVSFWFTRQWFFSTVLVKYQSKDIQHPWCLTEILMCWQKIEVFLLIVSIIYSCQSLLFFQNGIVHRDLKLENIFVDSKGNAKVFYAFQWILKKISEPDLPENGRTTHCLLRLPHRVKSRIEKYWKRKLNCPPPPCLAADTAKIVHLTENKWHYLTAHVLENKTIMSCVWANTFGHTPLTADGRSLLYSPIWICNLARTPRENVLFCPWFRSEILGWRTCSAMRRCCTLSAAVHCTHRLKLWMVFHTLAPR